MLQISVLGAIEVWRDGEPVRVPGGKTSELLVRLALDAGQFVGGEHGRDGRCRVQHRAVVTQQAFEVALPEGLPAGLRDATVVRHHELAQLGGDGTA